jgi:predicted ABC-class ATPase
VVAKIREAVRGAHTNFRSLYEAADRDSIPVSLLLAGSTLDKLTYNLGLLATSTAALSSNYVRALLEVRMTADAKLSDAITHDMDAVASCLQLMMPSKSSESVMVMDEHQCRNVADVVDRYDRTISSTLIHYNMCVRSSTATSIYHSPLYRSSLDVLVDGTNSLLGGMDEVRDRLREQQESAVAELRDSTKYSHILESVSLLNATCRGSQKTTSSLVRQVQLEGRTTRMSTWDT